MITAPVIAIVTMALVAIAATAFWNRRSRAERERQIAGRSAYSLEQIHTEHYAEEGIPFETVERALLRIGQLLDVDPRQLRITDRFDGILKPNRGWEFDDGLNLLGEDLVARSRTLSAPIDITAIRTVDDYIRAENRLGAGLRRAP